ncbi:MAG: histidinol-phosphate transaminase [Alphaproteobacteria bacterium]
MTGPAPRPGILDLQPYVGGLHSVPGVERVIVLASNESPLGPSEKAVAAFRDEASHLHRYPDGSAAALRQAIARRFGCDAGRIVCGSGSDELLGMLTRAYAGPGDEVLYSAHGFLMYPISAKSVGATPVAAPEKNLTTDVDALLARVNERTRVVFIANPNNPTGSYLTTAEMERLHAGLPPHVLLVIDAAYAEYCTRNDYTAGFHLVERHDNVVMTRTFSKVFGLAALRLGWAYCPPAVADVLNRIRGPFNVSIPAQAAGVAAMEDVAHTDRSLAHNAEWLPWLARELAALGLTVHPSVANFLLVQFASVPTAKAAYDFLLSQGIITRLMGGYGLPDCLRVTIGAGDELQALVDALARHLKP